MADALLPPMALQRVHEASAALQVRRTDLASRLRAGAPVDAEVVAVGVDGINAWLEESAPTIGEVLSAQPSGTAAGLRRSLPHNRAHLARGRRMVSLWDYWRTEDEVKELLAAEPVGEYVFGVVPIPMKILDRRYALLSGPAAGDEITVMKVWDKRCLEAAWHYWHTSLAHAIPFTPRRVALTELSARQRQVATFLASDLTDDAIASALGVSVRTVRADVAHVLQALGVRSRWAAGARLAVGAAPPGD